MQLAQSARSVLFGLSLAAILWTAGGCQVRNQFPDRRFARPYKPTAEETAYYIPEDSQRSANINALRGLPVDVQASFRAEHPEAAVTSTAMVPTGTGTMLYRVTYLEYGHPQQATYRGNGQDLNGPPEVIVRTK